MEVFTIKIAGPGINVEREINSNILADVLAIVLGGAASNRRNAQSPPPEIHDEIKNSGQSGYAAMRAGKTSLREYFDQVEPKRNPDKMVAIAKYAELTTGRDSFSRNDIKFGFKSAGKALPGNFSRDFNWTISNGWIAADSENSDSYYVTKKGNDALDDKFSDQVRKSTGLARRSRRRSKGKKDELET